MDFCKRKIAILCIINIIYILYAGAGYDVHLRKIATIGEPEVLRGLKHPLRENFRNLNLYILNDIKYIPS